MLSLSSRARAALLAGALFTLVADASHAQEVLTNESVVQMLTGKFPKDLMLLKIRNSPPGVDLSPEGLVYPTSRKVHQDLLKAMMSATDDAPRASEAPKC